METTTLADASAGLIKAAESLVRACVREFARGVSGRLAAVQGAVERNVFVCSSPVQGQGIS